MSHRKPPALLATSYCTRPCCSPARSPRPDASREDCERRLQAGDRPARQGCRLGADQRCPGRAHAEDGAGDRCRPRLRPRRRRWQDRNRGGAGFRRAGRSASNTTRSSPRLAQCYVASREARRARAHRPGRHLRNGFQHRDGRDAVPAARTEPAAAADDPQHEARHARGLALVPDGRLGAGRALDDRGRQRLPVDRARPSRRHLGSSARPTARSFHREARTEVPAAQRACRR